MAETLALFRTKPARPFTIQPIGLDDFVLTRAPGDLRLHLSRTETLDLISGLQYAVGPALDPASRSGDDDKRALYFQQCEISKTLARELEREREISKALAEALDRANGELAKQGLRSVKREP